MYGPLFTMTATDLMSRDVLTIPGHMSLKGAARLLAEARVSGAPVVDEEGRCRGVISATDFVRRAGKDKSAAPPVDSTGYWADWCIPSNIESLPEEKVAKVMTPDPVTVPPATALAELARKMVDAHIHRLIVVDERGRPIGIVSSMDILAAVTRASRPAERASFTPVARR